MPWSTAALKYFKYMSHVPSDMDGDEGGFPVRVELMDNWRCCRCLEICTYYITVGILQPPKAKLWMQCDELPSRSREGGISHLITLSDYLFNSCTCIFDPLLFTSLFSGLKKRLWIRSVYSIVFMVCRFSLQFLLGERILFACPH